MTSTWHPVTQSAPCLICKKPDWCTRSHDASCCMRVESQKPMANGGWLHPLDGAAVAYVKPRREEPRPSINCVRIMREAQEYTLSDDWCELAAELGVSADALVSLGFAFSKLYGCWLVPMRDGAGNIVGIQKRMQSGVKLCITGSHLGLFVPTASPGKRCFVCEGGSDTAALLSLGLFAIGRPSCSSRTDWIVQTVMRLRCREVVICSDNDSPGLRGAEQLQSALPVPSVIWLPPAKDVREMIRFGGTREMVESCVSQLVWRRTSDVSRSR